MSSFELDLIVISLSCWETISFLMLGDEYLMSFMDFSMRMGLIDVGYSRTESRSSLDPDTSRP